MVQNGGIGVETMGIERKMFVFPGEAELLLKVDSGAVEVALAKDFAGRMFTATRILMKVLRPFQLEMDSVGRAQSFLNGIFLVTEPVPTEQELSVLLEALENCLKEPEEMEEISC